MRMKMKALEAQKAKETADEQAEEEMAATVENLTSAVAMFMQSREAQTFIAKATAAILKEQNLRADLEIRRDFDGISCAEYLVHKMIAEYLTERRIAQ